MIYAVVLTWTNVAGFAISLAVIVLLFLLEAIRMRGNARQERIQSSYPALYDAMAQTLSAGSSFEQQFEYLSRSGPVELRPAFQRLTSDLEAGEPLSKAISRFKVNSANRHADLFAELVLIGAESGLSGQRDNWKLLAQRTRDEQGTTGLVLAKQDWVLGSAKVALLSPWLIAGLLMQLPQNKEAFASEAGSAVLVIGLSLSVFAYFLVNQLGSLEVQPRIFYEAR
jgi:tight adherence protein B